MKCSINLLGVLVPDPNGQYDCNCSGDGCIEIMPEEEGSGKSWAGDTLTTVSEALGNLGGLAGVADIIRAKNETSSQTPQQFPSNATPYRSPTTEVKPKKPNNTIWIILGSVVVLGIVVLMLKK